MFPIGAAGGGAASHRDDEFRFRHLSVQALDTTGHLDGDGTGNDHHIRLPRTGTKGTGAKAIQIVPGRSSRHHFDGAAC